MSQGKNQLDEQDEALSSFFDSLLKDVAAYAEQEAQATPKAQPSEPEQSVTVVEEPAADLSVYETLPPVATPPPVEVAATQQVVETTLEVATEPQVEVERVSTEPAVTEQPFQAMLFKVAGLTLAVPLVDLNGVIECDKEKITQMPGHADFYLGLIQHLDKTVPLVDTARLVLPPEKRKVLVGDDPLARVQRVVLINDAQYGLACDEVNEVVTLTPEDVRWRTERTQRRWLAGTVIEHMCALIDANAFAELLASRAQMSEFSES